MKTKKELISEVESDFAGDKINESIRDCIIAYIERSYSIGFSDGMVKGAEVVTVTNSMLLGKQFFTKKEDELHESNLQETEGKL